MRVLALLLVYATCACAREAGPVTEPSPSSGRAAHVLRVSGDGRQMWSVELEPGDDSPPSMRPIVDGDSVVTTMGGELRRLSLGNGDQQWRYRAGKTIYGAWLAGPHVLAVVDQISPDARVVAVDARSGREQWRWEPGGRGLLGTQVVMDDTDLAVLTSAHKLVVIDGATGRPRWQAEGKGGEFHGIETVPGAVLYSDGGALTSRDSKTGEVRWTAGFSPDDRAVVTSGVVTGSSVGAPRTGGPREGIDVETGKVLWKMPIEDGEDPGVMYPLDDAFLLEDSRSDRIRLIEPASGNVRWTKEIRGVTGEFGGLLQRGRTLHVLRSSPDDPAMLMFDMTSGRLLATVALDDSPDGTPAAAGDGVLLMVQGARPAIVSVEDEKVAWSFHLPKRATRGPTGLSDGGAVIEVVDPMTGTAF